MCGNDRKHRYADRRVIKISDTVHNGCRRVIKTVKVKGISIAMVKVKVIVVTTVDSDSNGNIHRV